MIESVFAIVEAHAPGVLARAFGMVPSNLTLDLDLSENQSVPSNGTIIVDDPTFHISGTTVPAAASRTTAQAWARRFRPDAGVAAVAALLRVRRRLTRRARPP